MATAFGQSQAGQATQVGRIGSGSNRSAAVAMAAPPSALLCSLACLLAFLLTRLLSHALLRYAFVDDSGTNGLPGFYLATHNNKCLLEKNIARPFYCLLGIQNFRSQF